MWASANMGRYIIPNGIANLEVDNLYTYSNLKAELTIEFIDALVV